MVAEISLMGFFGVVKRIGRRPMVDTEEHYAWGKHPLINQKQKQM